MHQNHLENAAMFVPTLLALAVFADESAPYDARIIPALAINWLWARIVYRIGYTSSFPFYRIHGTTIATLPTMIGIVYTLYRLVSGLASGAL